MTRYAVKPTPSSRRSRSVKLDHHVGGRIAPVVLKSRAVNPDVAKTRRNVAVGGANFG